MKQINCKNKAREVPETR